MSCPRIFEAEAMRDGRIGEAERAGFHAHAANCSACTKEIRALEALAHALREEPLEDPRPRADELHVRRERTRLLAAFDRELVTPSSPGLRRSPRFAVVTIAIAIALAIAAAVAVFLVLPPRRSVVPSPSQSVAIATEVAVEANGAVWSKRTDPDRERITLVSGELRVRVKHEPGARSIVVVLPDGELEDTGTTFTVSAAEGRTTRVMVEEGSVVLRLDGREPETIRAGGEWIASPPLATAPVKPTAPVREAAPDARSARPSPPVASAGSIPPAADASADFRAAMAALDAGDNVRAAAAFATFTATHPDDARAEDAAYLRIIALDRANDAAGSKQAAAEYLRRHPNGFRRADVERLAR